MSTSALEEKVTRNLTQTRALDAEFEAFKANTRPRGPGGSAAGGAYYNSAEVRLQAIEPAQARGVHQMLREQLEKQGATHFEYMAPEGARQFAAPWSSQNFDGVPLAVQYATAAILSAGPSLRGAETDMRVPFKGGGAELVTVWNDDAAHIEAADGTDASLPAVATGPPQAEAVRAHYGTGPIDGWSASELASLERALALLSPQELAAISGLPFRRGSSAPSDLPKPPPGLLAGEGKQCGAFRLKPGDTRIEIYDCAFQSEATGFVGGTDRPLPPSVRAILHEIGHAIAKRRIADLSSRMFASDGESSELAVEFNRQERRIDPSSSPATRRCGTDVRSRYAPGAGRARWMGAVARPSSSSLTRCAARRDSRLTGAEHRRGVRGSIRSIEPTPRVQAHLPLVSRTSTRRHAAATATPLNSGAAGPAVDRERPRAQPRHPLLRSLRARRARAPGSAATAAALPCRATTRT
jgi:hypothetical protein